LTNAPEAVVAIHDHLAALNRTDVTPDTRFKLLELYRGTISKLMPLVEEQIIEQPLPLSDKIRRLATSARQLEMELGQGYKMIIMGYLTKRFSMIGQNQLAFLVYLAMHALGRALTICYQSYAPTPAGIWSEIHQLYGYAVQQVMQDETLSDNMKSVNINACYKQILLLALVDPYRLMPGEAGTILGILEHRSNKALLLPLANPENPAGFFLVRLSEDKPPRAMSNMTVTDSRTDMLLNTVELARVLYQGLQELESGKPPASLGLSDSASSPAFLDLLRRLIKNWGIAPKRYFNRMRSKGVLEICTGINSVHYFLRGASPIGPGSPELDLDLTLQVSDSPDQTGQQAYSCTRWLVVNESASGVALIKNPNDSAQVRVGGIVGLRAGEPAAVTVGVVRWANSEDPQHLELGVQRLSPNAQPILLKPKLPFEAGTFEEALLLPEMPSLKQPASVLARHGLYEMNREYYMEKDGATTRIMATRLLEQTAGFDLFEFS
jgi:hypothetical protein